MVQLFGNSNCAKPLDVEQSETIHNLDGLSISTRKHIMLLTYNGVPSLVKDPSSQTALSPTVNKHVNRVINYVEEQLINKYSKLATFMTINLPLKFHFEMGPKKLKKKFREILYKMRCQNAILNGVLVCEYSKNYKFHCHILLARTCNFDKHVSKLRQIYGKPAIDVKKIHSIENIKNVCNYLCKDVVYMTSKKLIKEQKGCYTIKDTLNYPPTIVGSAKDNNTKLHKFYRCKLKTEEPELYKFYKKLKIKKKL